MAKFKNKLRQNDEQICWAFDYRIFFRHAKILITTNNEVIIHAALVHGLQALGSEIDVMIQNTPLASKRASVWRNSIKHLRYQICLLHLTVRYIGKKTICFCETNRFSFQSLPCNRMVPKRNKIINNWLGKVSTYSDKCKRVNWFNTLFWNEVKKKNPKKIELNTNKYTIDTKRAFEGQPGHFTFA